MKNFILTARLVLVALSSLTLISCASNGHNAGFHGQTNMGYVGYSPYTNYASRLPDKMDTGGGKLVLVDPNQHVWGAYDANGDLVKAGLATAGGDFCEDIGKPCRTDSGRFRITRMEGANCRSKTFPLPNGGGLMPHCMYFHNGEALHGSPAGTVVEANISHGCVRMRIEDAEWMQNNFASIGTTVVVQPY